MRAEKPHILMIDDDKRICALVSRYLHENGFIVMIADGAAQAFAALKYFECDAMVMDVMMPETDGLRLTQEMRARGYEHPIILLTALGEVDDRIKGFESGADDYLPKPFEPKELVMRLNAVLRRVQKRENSLESHLKIGSWIYDSKHAELKDGENIVMLTASERRLLDALSQTPGVVVSREKLAAFCDLSASERTIDVQINRLRQKIEENSRAPLYLKTVRGQGYLLRAERVS